MIHPLVSAFTLFIYRDYVMFLFVVKVKPQECILAKIVQMQVRCH